MRNLLCVGEAGLESRVMLAGLEAAELSTGLDSPVSFYEAAGAVPQTLDETPDQILVPAQETERLKELFELSLDTGVEEFTFFDADGNELVIDPEDILSQSMNSAVFNRPQGGIVRAHTHPFDLNSTDDLGETGFLTEANSIGDIIDFVQQGPNSENPLLGGLVQTGGTTYYALATQGTLDLGLPPGVALELESILSIQDDALELARGEGSLGGVNVTLEEQQEALDAGIGSFWNDFGLALYRGETGAQADGSTLLEKIELDEIFENLESPADDSSASDEDRARERRDRAEVRRPRRERRG